ncbi:MAG: DUF3990 domain-containing protein [Gammaproteobacteria bacterium]|nr:DUF3990 domain-containing protein [Rhodospirillaceae bacterium]MDE0365090.1 DUF3990 domain-containing protein [Gammaproteobacteria bacterium]
MPWTDQDLVLYHGSSSDAADNIQNRGIKLAECRALSDFGRGFYTTTNLRQAKLWADVRTRLRPRSGAAVLEFRVPRRTIAALQGMSFVIPGSDYWDLVDDSRHKPDMGHRHLADDLPTYYDVVFGPVAAEIRKAVKSHYDQISFHTGRAINVLEHCLADRLDSSNRLFRPVTP